MGQQWHLVWCRTSEDEGRRQEAAGMFRYGILPSHQRHANARWWNVNAAKKPAATELQTPARRHATSLANTITQNTVITSKNMVMVNKEIQKPPPIRQETRRAENEELPEENGQNQEG